MDQTQKNINAPNLKQSISGQILIIKSAGEFAGIFYFFHGSKKLKLGINKDQRFEKIRETKRYEKLIWKIVTNSIHIYINADYNYSFPNGLNLLRKRISMG